MAFNVVDRAQILVEALPYIQKYTGKTIVVKYGGNAMISDELRQAVISDIILLHLVGINVDLNEGDDCAECWGCDLTYDYVRINGDYRT